MITIADFPHILASLNLATILLLVAGYVFIRRGDRRRHRACMLAGLAVSVAFLTVYLTYHFNAGLAKFGGQGLIRPVYFTILVAHVLMSMAITVIVPATAFLAITGRFERHRRWARWALPVWLYVAVSGVVVYVLSIHLFPLSHG